VGHSLPVKVLYGDSMITRPSEQLRNICVVSVVIAIALIGTSWVFSNPPGAAPDEFATYTKAMANAYGELRPTPLPAAPRSLTGNALFNNISIGFFNLPGRFVEDPRWGCTRFDPGTAASCVDAPLQGTTKDKAPSDERVSSYVAFYPPGAFLLLGLPARLAPNADDALYVGRLASLFVCTALLGVAFAVTKGRWAILGLLAAMSPMALFLASTFNPSGIEIAAGLAFSAVLVAMYARTPSNWLWAGFLVSGVLLSVARSLGFLWVLMDVVLLLALTGPRRFWDLLWHHGHVGRVATLIVGLAALSTLSWNEIVGHSPHASIHQALHEIGPSIDHLRSIIDQFVGIFGWVDISMPHGITQTALVSYVAFVCVALLLTGWRARLSILGFALAIFAVAVGIEVFVQLPFGFDVQARYLMPVTVMVLILSGSLIDQRLADSPSSRLVHLSLIAAAIAAVGYSVLQLVAWLSNSRISAVGVSGSWWFESHARWTPPGGWVLWMTLASMGTLLLLAGSLLLVLVNPTTKDAAKLPAITIPGQLTPV
jgi:hypothetical protein